MNRMGIAVLFSVTFLCMLACSAFAVTWAKVYDHAIQGFPANSIQQTADGGYIVQQVLEAVMK